MGEDIRKTIRTSVEIAEVMGVVVMIIIEIAETILCLPTITS
jgi:hypothetical protein